MPNTTGEVLPSGLIIEPVKDMKRRLRSIYYRRITVKGGDMIWVKTGLLPSDPMGRLYYESKGFRLTPPEGTEFAPASEPKTEDKAIAEKDATIQALIEEVKALRTKIEANEKPRKRKKT